MSRSAEFSPAANPVVISCEYNTTSSIGPSATVPAKTLIPKLGGTATLESPIQNRTVSRKNGTVISNSFTSKQLTISLGLPPAIFVSGSTLAHPIPLMGPLHTPGVSWSVNTVASDVVGAIVVVGGVGGGDGGGVGPGEGGSVGDGVGGGDGGIVGPGEGGGDGGGIGPGETGGDGGGVGPGVRGGDGGGVVPGMVVGTVVSGPVIGLPLVGLPLVGLPLVGTSILGATVDAVVLVTNGAVVGISVDEILVLGTLVGVVILEGLSVVLESVGMIEIIRPAEGRDVIGLSAGGFVGGIVSGAVGGVVGGVVCGI